MERPLAIFHDSPLDGVVHLDTMPEVARFASGFVFVELLVEGRTRRTPT
jgi:hypothetical protein